jgi:hypothetical protein
MLALVLSLIWRQVPSVSELARLAARQRLLWTPPLSVSQQALSLRLRCLPPSLVERVVHATLPRLQERAAARTRPLPPVIRRARRHFVRVWIVDATKLEALAKKVGALRGEGGFPKGGTLLSVLDLASKLPVHLAWDASPVCNERHLLERVKAALRPRTLLLLDRGFYGFPLFDWLCDRAVAFVTRTRSDACYQVAQVLQETEAIRDRIVQFGQFRSNPCRHPLRLIEVRVGGQWYEYLTNVLDPQVLTPWDVAELYACRWRIEDAFSLVKRLLGLSYLWSGAANAIQLQVWCTFLLYGVLIDLCDQIAEVRHLPLERISVEMVYRGLYHFAHAYERGEATDPVAYLAAQTDLGIVKRLRPPRTPFDKQRQILNL